MTVELLRTICMEIHASAPPEFWTVPNEELARAWNGIGPEHWPKWTRKFMSTLLRPFSAAALIHDWEYSRSIKSFGMFTDANMRLVENVAREAVFDCHPALIPWGIIAGILCEFFGWKAYKEGKLK